MNANPNAVFPNEYGTTCFLKNVVTAPNIFVGDYTYSLLNTSPSPRDRLLSRIPSSA